MFCSIASKNAESNAELLLYFNMTANALGISPYLGLTLGDLA